MTATLLVLTAFLVLVGGVVLLLGRRLWWIALPAAILALLVMVAEGPRAGAELWGTRIPCIIAATQESLRLETMRPSGSRTSQYVVSHRFGAVVCYRLPGAPGFGAGAPTDPAILAAVGETPGSADILCARAPGQDLLRRAEIRLNERAHDAETVGRPVTVLVWRPLGLFEWAWSVDAPLLPMLPRPSFATGGTRVLDATVVSITIDTKGRSPISRLAREYAVPVAYVRLRYAPQGNQPPGYPPVGHPTELEGIDTVDAVSVAHLTAGARARVSVDAATPRQPSIIGASRNHWWRNPATEIAMLVIVVGLIVGAWFLLRRHRRTRVRAGG